ncbi:MAG: hypothetical protein ACYDA9_20635 [Terriglobia bacterium]
MLALLPVVLAGVEALHRLSLGKEPHFLALPMQTGAQNQKRVAEVEHLQQGQQQVVAVVAR